MADVAATLAGWSSTTSSNAPSGGTTIGAGLDDNLREIQGVITRGLSHKGADIASAATTDLGAIEGLMHDITGTTTITSFGTIRAGVWKFIKFEGALTLTHNATSLILPGAVNITTAVGESALMFSEGSGNWRCLFYNRLGVMSRKKVIATTADVSLSSNFAVTGAGFKPSSVIAFTTKSSSTDASFGFAGNNAVGAAVVVFPGTGYTNDANLIMYYDGTNVNRIGVSSYDSDGATFTRTVTGTPTGTLQIKFLFLE